MKILFSSDIHVDPGHLDRLLAAAGELEPEAVIVGGDLVPARAHTLADTLAVQQEWVERTLLPRLEAFHRARPHIGVFLDYGNDDLAASRTLLARGDGGPFTLIHGRVVPLGSDLALAGYMIVPPTPFSPKDWEKADCSDRTGLDGEVRLDGGKTALGAVRPHRLSLADGTIEADLESLTDTLASIPWTRKQFLFTSHSPPWNTLLDRLYGGRHVGSLAVRRFIERWGPTGRLIATLHGHIHEGPEAGAPSDRVSGVPAFNVGQSRGALRALLFDASDVENSARLVRKDSGKATLALL